VLVGIIGQVIVNSLGFHPSAKLVTAMAGAFPPELGNQRKISNAVLVQRK
jgi:hypothetical protein